MSAAQQYDLPLPTDSIEQGKKNLDRFGVTIHENFLSPSQVYALRERLDEQAAMEREQGVASFAHAASEDSNGVVVGGDFQTYVGRPVRLPPVQKVYLLVNKGRIFIELTKHPVALAYARHVLKGAPFNVGIQAGVIIRKGAPAQAIHIDQELPFNAPMPVAMTVVVALGKFTEDMGATRILPMSHRLAPPREGMVELGLETAPIELKPGSAAIWESRVWHGQGSSTSDTPRYSIGTLYTADFIKSLDCYPAVVHSDVYESMDEDERLLFNFSSVGYGGSLRPTDHGDNVHERYYAIPELRPGGDKRVVFFGKYKSG